MVDICSSSKYFYVDSEYNDYESLAENISSIDQLWTTTTFDASARTITVDISGYLMLLVNYRWQSSSDTYYSAFHRIGDSSFIRTFINIESDSDILFYSKEVTLTSTSYASFGTTYYKNFTSTTTSRTSTASLAPVGIYGIKANLL